jgi:hypothetical protein
MKFFFYILFFNNYKNIDTPLKKDLFSFFSVALIFSSINVEIFDRIAELSMFTIYLSIPLIFTSYKKYKLLFNFGLFIVFFIVYVRFLYSFSGGELLNYTLYF